MNEDMLIVMVGLPYSGKTTIARTMGYPIVSPDAIRMALHGQRFSPQAERHVWAIAHTMVEALFLAGHHTVILDSTANTPKRRDEWNDVKLPWTTRFLCVPTKKELCISRAQDNGDNQILNTIDRMSAEFIPLQDHERVYVDRSNLKSFA